MIAMPVRNGEKYIEAAVSSIVSQDLTEVGRVHVVVQDACSRDNTIAVLRSFLSAAVAADKVATTHFEFEAISEEDCGMYDAINRAMDATLKSCMSFDIFTWLNADDVMRSGAFANLVETFSSKEVQWVIGRAVDIDAQGGILRDAEHQKIDLELLRKGLFNYRGGPWVRAESTAFRSSFIRRLGCMNKDLRLAGDMDLIIKAAEQCAPTYVGYGIKGFRRHEQQLSKDLIQYEYERIRILSSRGMEAGTNDGAE
ncbi:MAG: glycosyltransferase [Burkholderiales bacterium]